MASDTEILETFSTALKGVTTKKLEDNHESPLLTFMPSTLRGQVHYSIIHQGFPVIVPAEAMISTPNSGQ